MARITYIIARVFTMDYKNMFKTVGNIHRKAGRNRIKLFIDMVKCGFKYGAGYLDYELFAFYDLTPAQRATYVTRSTNNAVVRICNNSDYYPVFIDKTKFNTTYAAFLGRDWVDFRDISREDFAEFIEGKTAVIIKPLDETCGRGIEKITVNEYGSAGEIYDYIKTTNTGLVEDYIIQHADIARINPYSVNTMRIMTVLKDGEAHILYCSIRIGNGGQVVDNLNSGGMASPIDIETGTILFPGYDKEGKLYQTHPMTGVRIEGTVIPFWKEAVDMCKKAALVTPQIGYCGWDVAITEQGPILIEANHIPGHDIFQLPAHTPNKIGMLPRYREFIHGI